MPSNLQSNSPSHLVITAEAVPHLDERIQTFQPEPFSSLEEPPLTNTNEDSLDSVDAIVDAQTRQVRCSKLERENLRQALISWRDQYWADVRSQYPFFSREWIITDGNIARLVDKAHLLFNQPRLDIAFVRGMIRTIADDTILSSLVTMLQAFCTAWRERDAQEAPDRRPKLAYRRSQDSDASEYLDTLDPGPDTVDTENAFEPKSSNNPSHLVATADAVPHPTERIQTFQPELVSFLEEPPLTDTREDSLDGSMDATILHAQLHPALRCSKHDRENLRQALISWRDQYWADVRSQYPFFSREWIITDKNINRLVDKAQLLLNEPRLDIDFVRGMMRTISDDTILSSLVTMLEVFFTALRERDPQEALVRRPKRAYRRRQDSNSANTNSMYSALSTLSLRVHESSSGN